MVDYKSNSYKSKEEKKADVPEKKVEKVISGTARTKKKTSFLSLRILLFLRTSKALRIIF